MPINDFDLVFTEFALGATPGQAITATALGNHVLDAGATRGRDWAAGGEIYKPWLAVRQAFNNLTSLQVDVIASDANDGTGNAVVLSTATILLASLTLNKNITLPGLSPGTYRRFLVGKFTVNGIAPSTGVVWLAVVPADALPQDNVLAL